MHFHTAFIYFSFPMHNTCADLLKHLTDQTPVYHTNFKILSSLSIVLANISKSVIHGFKGEFLFFHVAKRYELERQAKLIICNILIITG